MQANKAADAEAADAEAAAADVVNQRPVQSSMQALRYSRTVQDWSSLNGSRMRRFLCER